MARKKTRMPFEVVEAVKHRSRGRCEAQIPGSGCTKLGAHIHHRKFRSGGEDHSLANLLHLCTACHMWVHSHKRAAMEHGWAISNYTPLPPEECPVRINGRLALLKPSGVVEWLLEGVLGA